MRPSPSRDRQDDRAGLDNLGRKFRFARANPAALHEGERHQGARPGPRHRPGARDRGARRCGSRAGARSRSRGGFIAEGHGIDRRQIAWNDSSWSGRSDPAHIARRPRCGRRLKAIAAAGAVRVARRQERHRCAGKAPVARGRYRPSRPAGAHGTAISAAAWARRSTRQRRWQPIRCPIAAPGSASATRRDLAVLVEGDPALLNRYDVILLDPGSTHRPGTPPPAASPTG